MRAAEEGAGRAACRDDGTLRRADGSMAEGSKKRRLDHTVLYIIWRIFLS
jgi:hypothetical protein